MGWECQWTGSKDLLLDAAAVAVAIAIAIATAAGSSSRVEADSRHCVE